MGGGFEEQGSAAGAVNINPFTEDIMSTLQGALSKGQEGAEGILNDMSNFSFLDILGDKRLQDIIGKFAGERNTLADQAAAQAQRQISGSYAGTGLYSGAFGEAVGRGVGETRQAAVTDIAGKQLGLFGQALGITGAQQGQALDYFGRGESGALAGLSGIAQPEFYNPTYAYDPGPLGDLANLFGTAASATMTGFGLKELFG